MPQRLLLEGSDIDELLERVRTEHGPEARIVHAEQKLVGGVGGFFAKRRFEVAVAVDDAPSGPASIDDLLALADAQDGAAPRDEPSAPPAPVLPAPSVPQPETAPLRQPGRQVSTESESFDDFVRELIAQAEGGPLHVEREPFVPATVRVEPAPDLASSTPPATTDAPSPAPAPASAPAPSPSSTTDPRLVLLDRLSSVAVEPPRALTGTQVVVGPREHALAVARAWAAQCGEDDAAILDVEAGDTVSELRRPQGQARVVVVDSDGTVGDCRRAGRRIAALGADAVTAVVDARWDVATTSRSLDALRESGVRLTAVAAHAVADAADPLRLLELALPVTWLDARPATLGTWAAPCLDRL